LGYDSLVRAAGLLAMLAPAACVRAPAEAVCPELAAGDLIVTEVRGPQDPEDASGSWLELYNASDAAIDLRGIKIRFRTAQDPADAGIPILVRSTVAAPASAYVVLGLFDDNDRPPHVDYGFLDDFGDAGGDNAAKWMDNRSIHVESCGAPIDRADHDGLPVMGTRSLGGEPDANRNDLAGSWCSDATQVGATFPGTPRRQNITCPVTRRWSAAPLPRRTE
jgi:hypothetical protein